ncbi:MAG: hypothetical protein HY691_05645 [Chloroflexi bacterium]|nr:hypothetical protein [Chloroflexota bacterium]
MHDAVALERQGIPTVVVAHHTFAFAAATQAKTMGLADLPLVVMPRPEPTWTADEIARVVIDLAKHVAPALTTATAVPAPR